MNQYEAYLFLLCDTFFSNLVLSPNSELAIHAMKIFGNYDNFFMLGVLAASVSCAIIINYVLGMVFYNLYKFSSDQKVQETYQKLSRLFHKYGSYILLLVAILPFGQCAVLIAGFVKLGILRTVCFAALSKVMYYAYILYT